MNTPLEAKRSVTSKLSESLPEERARLAAEADRSLAAEIRRPLAAHVEQQEEAHE